MSLSLLQKRSREIEQPEEETHYHKKQAVSQPEDSLGSPRIFEDCLDEVAGLLHAQDALLTTLCGNDNGAYLQGNAGLGQAMIEGALVNVAAELLAPQRRRIVQLVERFIREGAYLHKSQLALNARIVSLFLLTSTTSPLPLPPTLQRLLQDVRRETRDAIVRVEAERGGHLAGPMRLWSEFEDDVTRNRLYVQFLPLPGAILSQLALSLSLLQLLRRHQEVILRAINAVHEVSDVAAQVQMSEEDVESYTHEARLAVVETGRLGHAVALPIKSEYVRITRSMTRA